MSYLKGLCNFCLLFVSLNISFAFRYWTQEGELTVRNVVHLEHTLPSPTNVTWTTDATEKFCQIEMLNGSYYAELRCTSAGLYTVNLECYQNGNYHYESQMLYIDNSFYCYHWYIADWPTCNGTYWDEDALVDTCSAPSTEKTLCLWVVDPVERSNDEKLYTANYPSEASRDLTRQFHSLQHEPEVHTVADKPHGKTVSHTAQGYSQDESCWLFEVSQEWKSELFVFVTSKPRAVHGCLIKDTSQTFQKLSVVKTFEDSSATMLQLKPVKELGIIKDPCHFGRAVLVTNESIHWTTDGFSTSSVMNVPPEDPALFEGHDVLSVTSVAFTVQYLIVLADGALYAIDVSLPAPVLTLIQDEVGFTSLRGRDWCSDCDDFLVSGHQFLAWNESSVVVYTLNARHGGTEYSHTVIAAPVIEGNQTKIITAAFSTLSKQIGIILKTSTTENINAYIYNLDTNNWQWFYGFSDASEGEGCDMIFLWSGITKVVMWSGSLQIHFFTMEDNTHESNSSVADFSLGHIQHVTGDRHGNLVFVTSEGDVLYTTVVWTSPVQLALPLGPPGPPAYPWLDLSEHLFTISPEGSTIHKDRYALWNEKLSALYPYHLCPVHTLETSAILPMYTLDVGESVTVWAAVVYHSQLRPCNDSLLQLYLDGPTSLIDVEAIVTYETNQLHVQENMSITFRNAESVNINELRGAKNQIGVDIGPAVVPPMCNMPVHTVSYITVGCLSWLGLQIEGTTTEDCEDYHNTNYTITYKQGGQRETRVIDYDFARLGCPLRVSGEDVFIPPLLICRQDDCEPMTANFVIWEVYNREFNYNTSMKKVGCRHKAQSWAEMWTNSTEDKATAWGPDNYESCFNNGSSREAVRNDKYEILNISGYSGIEFPKDASGVYEFTVRVVDPSYSFCDLSLTFTVFVRGEEEEDMTTLGVCVLTCVCAIVVWLLGSYVYFRENRYADMLHEPEEEEEEGAEAEG